MKCTDVRGLLAGWLYDDLSPQESVAVAQHLAGCPSCREQQAALTEVRRLLDLAPTTPAQVSVPRVYAEAARRQQALALRWRRLTISAVGAAAVLLLAFALRFEIDWRAGQLTVCWGKRPAESALAPKQVERAPVPPPPRPEVTGADFRLLKDLVHALATTVVERDTKVQETLTQLSAQLEHVEEQARARWDVTERFVSALHTAQMAARLKGER